MLVMDSAAALVSELTAKLNDPLSLTLTPPLQFSLLLCLSGTSPLDSPRNFSPNTAAHFSFVPARR